MARHPIDDLPKIMGQSANAMLDSITLLMRRAATVAGTAVVKGTRVDTGMARSNWVGSLNRPINRVRPPYAPGKNLGINEGANAAGAIAQHTRIFRLFNVRFSKSLHITNSVRYIGFLNNGSPKTGPPDLMVQKAIQAAKRDIRKNRIDISPSKKVTVMTRFRQRQG